MSWNPSPVEHNYILFIYTLLVCVSVCIQKTSKRLNRSGQIFFVRPHLTPGKVYGWYFTRLSVCLYPKNVKAAEPIRPKFCVGPHVALGKDKGLWMIKILNICLQQNLIFENSENPRNFLLKSTSCFLFCFRMYTKRTCSQLNCKMGAKRTKRLCFKYEYIALSEKILSRGRFI